MFGNHDYQTAVKIAAEKSKESGKEHIVVNALGDNGKPLKGLYTIGVPIEATSFEEIKAILSGKGARR